MNILCIETSAALCSVAVLKGNESYYVENAQTLAHAEFLMDLIKECLQKSSLDIKHLNAVAISGGPGSYTGLRIGSSTAKGICYALGIPLIALDTLKVIANAAKGKNNHCDYYWAMLDARRMEVYHVVFNEYLEKISPTQSGIITDDNFQQGTLTGNILLCGDGATKATSVLNIPDAGVVANAESMCDLAKEEYINSNFVDVAYYEPFYLKQANITVSKS